MLRLVLIILLVLNAAVFVIGRGWLASTPPAGEPERLANQISPENLQLSLPRVPPAKSAAASAPSRSEEAAPANLPEAEPLPSPTTSAPAVPPPQPSPEPPPSAADIAAAAAPALPPQPESGTTSAEATERTEQREPAAEPLPPAAPAVSPAAPEPAASDSPSPVAAAAPASAEKRICLAYASLTLPFVETLQQVTKEIDPDADILQEPNGPPINWWVHIPPLDSAEIAEQRAKELRANGVSDLFIVREAGPNQFSISLGIFKTHTSAQQHLLNLQQQQKVEGAIISPRTPVTYKVEVRGREDRLTPLISRNQPNLPVSTGRCTL